MQCPNCGSVEISAERMPPGDSLLNLCCRDCSNYWVKTYKELTDDHTAYKVLLIDAVGSAENELIAKIVRVTGYIPGGTKDLLHVLLHPDIIELTENYIKAWKEANL